MRSCLALSGVCHTKKAGLRNSAHTPSSFLVSQGSLEVHGPHTDTLMLRLSWKVNLFNTVIQVFFFFFLVFSLSLLQSNAAAGSLSALTMHLVVRNLFSCSLKPVPENLGTELNWNLSWGSSKCTVHPHYWPTILVVLWEVQLHCQFSQGVLLGI